MAAVFEGMTETKSKISAATTQVFDLGNLSTTSFLVERSSPSSLPKQLFIVTPTKKGTYPVLMFFHGTSLSHTNYSQLLHHISSHGFIVVAPQLYTSILASNTAEVKAAAAVTNWLPTGLSSVLPEKVRPDLQKLALSGHSRGGKTAFALALGRAETALSFSALIGVDPVDGMSKRMRPEPKILSYEPRSLDLGIPVAVVGTGLGDEPLNYIVRRSCAPDGVSHEDFFHECQPPCAHFVAADYGHMDIVDDSAPALPGCLCKRGKGPKELMRRGVGGVAVAFLRAFLENEEADLRAVLEDPNLAPLKLDPVEFIEK